MDARALEAVVNRLRHVQLRGGLPVDAEGARDWYEVMFYAPASESEIAGAQKLLGKRLPADFLEFWRATSGANLYLNESGLHGVGVASTELIVDLQQEEAQFYGPEALGTYAVFARVNGSGDFLVFDLETGRVLDGVHAEQPSEWRRIADSFTDWLATFVETGGRYYWLEALLMPAGLET